MLKGMASYVWAKFGDKVHTKELPEVPTRIKLIFDDSVFEAVLAKHRCGVNEYIVINGVA